MNFTGLYPRSRELLPLESRVKTALVAPDLSRFPEFALVTRFVGCLGPGDCLWIPAGWWHEVFTPSFTVAFNMWFAPSRASRYRLRPTMLYLRSDAIVECNREQRGRRASRPETHRPASTIASGC